MDGNQSSNPLDYSQNSVVYKEVNGNNTASTSIVTEQNTMNSTPMIPLNQVRDLLNFWNNFLIKQNAFIDWHVLLSYESWKGWK